MFVQRHAYLEASVPLGRSLVPVQSYDALIKSGNKHSVMNCRPIALISPSSKMHLVYYMASSPLAEYFGRLPFSLVRSMILSHRSRNKFTHELTSSINWKARLDVIFVDYTRTLCQPTHRKILRILKVILPNSKLFYWIADKLSVREQSVSYLLPFLSPRAGTQASVLGLLLYLKYVNDVVKNIVMRIRVRA